MTRHKFLLLALLLASICAKAQSSKLQSPFGRHSSNNYPVTTHERFATFLAGQYKAQLVIQNLRLDVPLTVTPGLIINAGEIPLNPITIAAHSESTVDINAELKSHGVTETRGAVVVRYDFSTYGALSAVVEMSDYEHRLYLNSIAQSREEFWFGTTLDAVVWTPLAGTEGFVSMINTSTEPKTVHVSFSANGATDRIKEITIPAHRNVELPIDALLARSVPAGAGIHIAFTGNPGDIVAEGTLINQKTGFSKYIRFVDKDLRYSTASIRTNFLLLGSQPSEDGFPDGLTFKSVAAVRNVGASPTTITPEIRFLQDGGVHRITLRPLVVNANQVKLIDFGKEQRSGHIPPSFMQGILEIAPSSSDAAVIAELFNFSDATGGYVVGPSFTAHPARATEAIWRTDGTFQTTVVIENTASEDDQITAKIFSDARTWQKTFPIAAGGILKISLKELQTDAVPDQDGNLISGTSGTFSFSGARRNKSSLTYDKIIHSSDESDYVGHVGQPCDFVASISAFLEGDQNPFTSVLEEDWTDGSTYDYPGWPGVSSNPNLVSVDAGGAVTFLPNGDGSIEDVNLTFTDTTETCDECTTGTLTDVLGLAGRTVFYVANTCTVNPFTGAPTMVASWEANNFACGNSDSSPPLPTGGSCVVNGIKNCYKTVTPTCQTIYCPGDKRTMDTGCTRFLDKFPIISSTFPGGCS